VAALAEGPSQLAGYSSGADCRSTLTCLRALGVQTTAGNGTITVVGRGLGGLRPPDAPLDAGNSGTTMRMLAGVLAGQAFAATMVGDESLSRRPMRRVIEPLTLMGALIESTDGHAPLTIRGGVLHAIDHRPEVPSAQIKSAVLLAGLHAEGRTTVTETAETRDHTERALAAFGAAISRRGPAISVEGRQQLVGRAVSVPGDFSSAAYWMVAAAALPGSRVEIEGVGLNPTRTALVGVLRRFGALVSVHPESSEGDEPRGTIVVEHDRTGEVTVTPEEVPSLIDELPAIAALAAHGGDVTVRGAAELRVKESDRIAALVDGLRRLGIGAEEWPDGFAVHGGGAPPGGSADAHGDHRIAMAMAIAALGARAASRIEGADSVAISYPDFFETLGRLVA
jgi:3-phosphoshikimate 1-carboxyvinyltransferase